MRESIIQAAQEDAVDGELSCQDAHAIAAKLDISPLEVGKAVNRASDLRFNRCQLGLFGYGSKAEGKHKIVVKAAYVPGQIEAAIRAQVHGGAIPCAATWEIADQFQYPRLGIGNIVESLGLKVSPCQLGCF